MKCYVSGAERFIDMYRYSSLIGNSVEREGLRARAGVRLAICVSAEMKLTDAHMKFIMYCLHLRQSSFERLVCRQKGYHCVVNVSPIYRKRIADPSPDDGSGDRTSWDGTRLFV